MIFMLENSHRLAAPKYAGWLNRALSPLQHTQPGYHITKMLLNTRDHGVPQYRERLYLVGYRRDLAKAGMAPLQALDRSLQLRLSDVLCPPHASDDPARLPPASWMTARHNVTLAQLRAAAELPPHADWMVAQAKGISMSGSTGPRPREEFPALLHSNRTGHWVGSRGRPATVSEHFRAQGFSARDMRYHAQPPHDLYALLGNAMSINVLQRLMTQALNDICHCGLIDGWAAGLSQRNLVADAVADRTFFGQRTVREMFSRTPPTIACAQCGGLHDVADCPYAAVPLSHHGPRPRSLQTHAFALTPDAAYAYFRVENIYTDHDALAHALLQASMLAITVYTLRRQLALTFQECATVLIDEVPLASLALADVGIPRAGYPVCLALDLPLGGPELWMAARHYGLCITVYAIQDVGSNCFRTLARYGDSADPAVSLCQLSSDSYSTLQAL